MLMKGYTKEELGYEILKPLSNKQILNLIKFYRSSDDQITKQKTIKKIFQHNLAFIVTAYNNYKNMMSMHEFISISFEAVFISVSKYDMDSGNSFLTVLGFNIKGCVTKYCYNPRKVVDLEKSDSIQFSVDGEDDEFVFPVNDKLKLDNKRLFSDIHKLIDKSKFNPRIKEAIKLIINREHHYSAEFICEKFGFSLVWLGKNKKDMFEYIKRNIKIENYELEF